MNVIKKWLAFEENIEMISLNKLAMILDDVNSNRVALKGGNMFSITYSLIGNVRKRAWFFLLISTL